MKALRIRPKWQSAWRRGRQFFFPSFWQFEILNALVMGEKRKRISSELTHAFLAELLNMPITVDSEAHPSQVFGAVHSLSRKHQLTAYDAAYLELALRKKCILATVDDDLRKAMLAEQGHVLGD